MAAVRLFELFMFEKQKRSQVSGHESKSWSQHLLAAGELDKLLCFFKPQVFEGIIILPALQSYWEYLISNTC